MNNATESIMRGMADGLNLDELHDEIQKSTDSEVHKVLTEEFNDRLKLCPNCEIMMFEDNNENDFYCPSCGFAVDSI